MNQYFKLCILAILILTFLSGKAFSFAVNANNDEPSSLVNEGNKLLGKGYFGEALLIRQKILE